MSAMGFEALASQCSDSQAVEAILKVIFGIYNGSEGKLSLAGVKVSVLEAAGRVSKNSVAGGATSADFCKTTMAHFFKVTCNWFSYYLFLPAARLVNMCCFFRS